MKRCNMREQKKTLFILNILLLSILLLTSCATEMSTRASRVRLVSVEQVHELEVQCETLGNIQGTSYPCFGCLSWWTVMRKIAHNNALNELLDNAAELGATHIFVNLGDYPDLRGEAYRCCRCLDRDGKPDEAFCLRKDGTRDTGNCVDGSGKDVGQAQCVGAEANNREDCKAKGGAWIKAMDQGGCEARGYKWIPKAEDRATCEEKSGVWYPKAEDQVTCEEVKKGKWTLNGDVLKRIPGAGLSPSK